MLNKTKIRKYLNVIRHATSLIEAELDDDGTMEELFPEVEVAPKPVKKKTVAKIVTPVETVTDDTEDAEEDDADEMEDYKEARQKHIKDLLAIDCWPEAIPNYSNVEQTDKDQKKRANAVLDMILDKSIEGLSFLDFGCGEGWVAQEAKRRGASSVLGYDPQFNEKWKDISGCRFVHTLGPLTEHSFDVVLLFDVLDHCTDIDEVMDTVLNVVKKNGVVYIRNHPWTSIHATHLYKQGLNKAYMHLFLTWQELKDITGQDPMFTRPEQNPLEAYRWWFRNFKIVRERVIAPEPVNEFFKNPDFKKLLTNEQNLQDVDEFLKRMEVMFVDYILTPKI